MALSQESANKIRQKSLHDQERIQGLTKELESNRKEVESLTNRWARRVSCNSCWSCNEMLSFSRLVNTESRLRDAERKTEALATLQSHRWMEFSKMADNMKDLSQNMLSQSKSNTRKAAIRADLDEELDLWNDMAAQ